MVIIKVPSVWMIYLPATQSHPSEWLNLALVKQVICLEDEKVVQITFVDGKMIRYEGDRAMIIIEELYRLPARLAE